MSNYIIFKLDAGCDIGVSARTTRQIATLDAMNKLKGNVLRLINVNEDQACVAYIIRKDDFLNYIVPVLEYDVNYQGYYEVAQEPQNSVWFTNEYNNRVYVGEMEEVCGPMSLDIDTDYFYNENLEVWFAIVPPSKERNAGDIVYDDENLEGRIISVEGNIVTVDFSQNKKDAANG